MSNYKDPAKSRAYMREYMANRYKNDPVHRELQKRRNTASGKKQRKSRREFLNQLKSRPCVDCGKKDHPFLMDFDHRLGELRLFQIGEKGPAVSLKRLEEELAKCDVVCCRCHRIRTYNRTNEVLIIPPLI